MCRPSSCLAGERGARGTAAADVLEHSGAPRDSVYHHFPGGKPQLVEEAARYAGDLLSAGLIAALEEHEPVATIDTLASYWIGGLTLIRRRP